MKQSAESLVEMTDCRRGQRSRLELAPLCMGWREGNDPKAHNEV